LNFVSILSDIFAILLLHRENTDVLIRVENVLKLRTTFFELKIFLL